MLRKLFLIVQAKQQSMLRQGSELVYVMTGKNGGGDVWEIRPKSWSETVSVVVVTVKTTI